MLKAKLCSIAIICAIGYAGLNSSSAIAAETDTRSVTLSERERNQKDKRTAFEEKMNTAYNKWNSLSKKQKNEVYSMLESQLQIELKIIDKLAEFDVLEKEDAALINKRMQDNFNKMKKGSEFPFGKPKAQESR